MTDVVTKWQHQFTLSASAASKEKATTLLSRLNYNNGAKFNNPGGGSLYLIEVSSTIDKKKQFIGIISEGESYRLDGIYESDQLSTIRNHFSKRGLDPGQKIVVKGLDGFTIKGWRMTSDGEMLTGVAQPSTTRVKDFAKVKVKTAASETRMDYMQPIDEPCIYHYYIWYYEETGQIISISFEGTTGNCGNWSEGGGGGDTPPESSCNNTLEDAEIFLDQIKAVESSTILYSTGEAVTDPIGNIRAPKISRWPFVTLDMSKAYQPEYSALFTGVIHNRYGINKWQWFSFGFDKSTQTAGHTPPCTKVDVTTSVATVISADSTKADVELFYAARAEVSCLSGSQWKNIKSSTLYNTFKAGL